MLGRQTLGELFAGRSRLNVYLLPFDPGRDEGYVSYSSGMDRMDGMLPRLNARDVTFVGVSPARPPELEAFRERMAGSFFGLCPA